MYINFIKDITFVFAIGYLKKKNYNFTKPKSMKNNCIYYHNSHYTNID